MLWENGLKFAAFSQSIYYKSPPARTTSSKAAPLLATCAWSLGSHGAALCWGSPSLPTLPAVALTYSPCEASPRTSTAKTTAQNLMKYRWEKAQATPQTCCSTTTFAPALPNTARLRGHQHQHRVLGMGQICWASLNQKTNHLFKVSN